MKKLAVDLKAFKKEINALSRKLDQLTKKADKLMQAQKASKAKPKAAAKGKAKPKAKAKVKVETDAAASNAPKKAAQNSAAATPTDQVLKIMKRYKKGVNIAKIKDLTGFNDKQISNIVHRASKKGRLERVERGVYKLA